MGSSSSSHERKKKIIKVFKLLLLVISLGYMMLWIMMPTSSYMEIWLPTMRAKTKSTFFGLLQGSNLLFYTFPVLLIAALGCVYLHLEKKLEDNHNESDEVEKNSISSWKQPALVKGPLGIVSGIELTFITMFVALLVWSFFLYLHRDFPKIGSNEEEGWKDKLESIGLRLGLVGNICLALLFFPVTRGSSVLPLIGLTSESSIKYHIWLGHIAMTIFTGHGLCYILPWASENQLQILLSWKKTEISILAGVLALLSGLAMWATSFQRVRRKMFEVFFYTHHLYSLFLIFFVLHIGVSYYSIMLPGLYLFLIDRYIRFLQSRQSVQLVSSRILPCQTVELNFSKDPRLNYTTTSILFVNIPSISKLQWHPFTISSNSNLEPERLSVIIKREGSWTKKLYDILFTSVDNFSVSVEGPYGPTSTHFLRHDTLVMVSGGSGITPFFSIIREIIFRSSTMNTKTPRILLICSFKYSSELTMLDLLLPISGTPSDISSLEIQIEAYVTREKQATIDNNKNHVRTIWFKPKVSDIPISSILGPNSMLWLGAIICSSFILFLILLGIITRFYIYPIDHNTNKIYPFAWKALINISIIFVSIAVTTSMVVLRNKKRNTVDVLQIQEKGASTTPTASPNGFYNADRELESLPSQSLVQKTNVHFGSRPDLKKILHGCEGSSVGVLVCGPSMMRHEVASICSSQSSGTKDNLHFESISFSW